MFRKQVSGCFSAVDVIEDEHSSAVQPGSYENITGYKE
jgi:hypothetical protein